MYKSFYGFSEKPFNLTPDPDFLYLSQNHKEALAHLAYGVESKSGFVLVTGDVGAGKTTLLRTLIRNLGENVLLSQVSNTSVSYKELLEMILLDFGVQPGDRGKTELLSLLNDFLIERYREGKNCVLLIDEAQNLGVPTLEGVRMLSNLETEKDKLLHTILVGQPGLRDLIDSRELEQLRQRISVRYHLGPLTVGEVGEYIRHRLGKVEREPEKGPIFPDEVIPKIHEATSGLPRLINVLCDAALLHAYVGDARVVTPEIISSASVQLHKNQQGHVERSGALRSDNERVDDRISKIEARLNAMLADATQTAISGSSNHRLNERANHLVAREKALWEREVDLDRRAAGLERREKELAERVTSVREEWKKRVERLERSRRELSEGSPVARFPGVSLHAYDPDASMRSVLRDALGRTGEDTEVHDDYAAFHSGLQISSRCGRFCVGVLGSEVDDTLNVERVDSLTCAFPHVPLIYVSDLDLSTLRRRILTAGATYFIEKPNSVGKKTGPSECGIDLLNEDLVQAVHKLVTHQRAILEAILEVQDLPLARGTDVK